MQLKALLAFLAVSLHTGLAQAHQHSDASSAPPPTHLGIVSFEISCSPQVTPDFNRAVALLHSFWHEQAKATFEKVAAAEPECAMAYWGEALTDFHQILDLPSPADIAAGQRALAMADGAHEKSPREAAYIQALHAFYDGYEEKDYYVHAQRYAQAMEKLVAVYPTDVEGKVFYALSLLAADADDDVTLVNPRKAVAVLAPLLQQHPDHPGIAHYMIHACDNPQMARLGLSAARRYASVAPAAPHALHMPAHIYARLGLWQDDIQSNLASKAASERTTRAHIGAENRLHAMEFLEYAYLQTGQDERARALVEEGRTIEQADLDPTFAGYFSTVEARFAALYTIETQDWNSAARLQPIPQGGRFSLGLTLLAHAMAAGHRHDAQAGREAAETFNQHLEGVQLPPGVAIPTVRDEIHAWSDYAEGHLEEALTLLRSIADRQDRFGKEEVDLPAREMLAKMLQLEHRPTEAFREYQASLRSDPNRFNTLLGAAQTAEELRHHSLAVRYYRQLLANCGSASGVAIEQLAHARAVVAGSPSRHEGIESAF